jgi:hypothetical protein
LGKTAHGITLAMFDLCRPPIADGRSSPIRGRVAICNAGFVPLPENGQNFAANRVTFESKEGEKSGVMKEVAAASTAWASSS